MFTLASACLCPDMSLNNFFSPCQDLEEQLEEEESARQRLLLEKVSLETKVKSLETDLLSAVEQRDRFNKVGIT